MMEPPSFPGVSNTEVNTLRIVLVLLTLLILAPMAQAVTYHALIGLAAPSLTETHIRLTAIEATDCGSFECPRGEGLLCARAEWNWEVGCEPSGTYGTTSGAASGSIITDSIQLGTIFEITNICRSWGGLDFWTFDVEIEPCSALAPVAESTWGAIKRTYHD